MSDCDECTKCDDCDDRITSEHGYCPDCDRGYCPDCDRGDCEDCRRGDCDDCDRGNCDDCDRIDPSEAGYDLEDIVELLRKVLTADELKRVVDALEADELPPLVGADQGYIAPWYNGTDTVKGLAAYVPRKLYVANTRGYAIMPADSTDTHVAIHFSKGESSYYDAMNALRQYGLTDALNGQHKPK